MNPLILTTIAILSSEIPSAEEKKKLNRCVDWMKFLPLIEWLLVKRFYNIIFLR